jgi:hypothetical protein
MDENDMGEACSMYWDEENTTEYLIGISEGERLLRKSIVRWGIILQWILKKYPADHNGGAI